MTVSLTTHKTHGILFNPRKHMENSFSSSLLLVSALVADIARLVQQGAQNNTDHFPHSATRPRIKAANTAWKFIGDLLRESEVTTAITAQLLLLVAIEPFCTGSNGKTAFLCGLKVLTKLFRELQSQFLANTALYMSANAPETPLMEHLGSAKHYFIGIPTESKVTLRDELSQLQRHPAVQLCYLARLATQPDMHVIVAVVDRTSQACMTVPAFLHSGLPVKQVTADDPVECYAQDESVRVNFSEANMLQRNVAAAARTHLQAVLMRRKNVVSVRVDWVVDEWVCVVGVWGLGLIPAGEPPIPKQHGEVKVLVQEARAFRCSDMIRWTNMNCLQPGTAIAATPLSRLQVGTLMGTMGVIFSAGGRQFGVTAGHVFNDENYNLLPAGTTISQSCGLALLMNLWRKEYQRPDPVGYMNAHLSDATNTGTQFIEGCIEELQVVSHLSVEQFENANPTRIVGTLLAAVEESTQDIAVFNVEGPTADTYNTMGCVARLAGCFNIPAVFDMESIGESCWTEEDFRSTVENEMYFEGFTSGVSTGPRCGRLEGFDYSAKIIVPGKQPVLITGNIMLRVKSVRYDSGSFVWTTKPGGCKKLVGMLICACAGNGGTLLLPIWKIVGFVKSVVASL